MIDIDDLLSRTSPSVVEPEGLSDAMGATARSITHASGRPSAGILRRSGPFLAGAAAAAVAATAIVTSGSHTSQPGRANATPPETRLELLAAKAAPVGLPLPDGVSIEDAKAFVSDLVQANPSLQEWAPYVLDRGVLVAHEKGQVAGIPRRMQESGITAAYVFYAQCQWKRTLVGKRLTSPFLLNRKPVSAGGVHASQAGTISFDPKEPGVQALAQLGDPSSWSSEGYNPPDPAAGEHGGIIAMPMTADGRPTFDEDFATNCTNGFGDAPKGNK